MSKIYSVALKSIILPFGDKLMKTSISSYQKKIKELNKYSSEDINTWQCSRLMELLSEAYNNTDYYRRIIDENDIDYSSINDLAILDLFPVLTKQDIRANFDQLTNKNIHQIPHKKGSTGGSTGDPLVYLQDHNSWSFASANMIVNWERVGYNYGDKYLAVGSTSLFVNKKKSFVHNLYYSLKNKIGVNGVNMSDEVCYNYLQIVNNKKVKFIYGYASSIYRLAQFALKTGIKVNVKAVMPTSEVLSTLFKNTIKQAFECDIINTYGANDGGITAFAVNEDFFNVGYNTIVRYSNENGPQRKIFLTDLFNFAMPLINYEIGDQVITVEGLGCKKNYNGQVFRAILGRTSDLIELENGSVLTGPGFTILFKDIPVDYFHIEKTGVNSITIKIKPLDSYNETHEKLILSTLMKQMGEGAFVNIVQTNEVLYSASGKRKYFS